MNALQQILSEAISRTLSQAPGSIARSLPGWIKRSAKAYVRWLWRLDLGMKFVMLVINVVVLQILASKLPGPTSSYEQLVRLAAIGLVFFCLASILFSRPRG